MSSNSSADACEPGETLCVIRVHEQEVFIIPSLLFISFLAILLAILLLRFCPERRRARTTAPRWVQNQNLQNQDQNPGYQRSAHRLHGVDAPGEFNILEHEVVPMTIKHPSRNLRPTPPPPAEWQRGAFSQVSALTRTLAIEPDAQALYRAQLDGQGVVLRVLTEAASSAERRDFLGFTSFLWALGSHPFLPALLGVVSMTTPLTMVVEELEQRDLLGFLWRCRQHHPAGQALCELTEKRIFLMAEQVASALEYLHGRGCIHGNVAARSVLIGGDLTAKLWGLGPAYRRGRRGLSPETRKWHAPEVLAGRAVNHSSDVWSLGVLLYEMVTLGEPPFPQVQASALLQHLQRGRSLKRPHTCSNALYSIIRSCGQWSVGQRPPVAQLIRRLRSGVKTADGRTVLRAPEPMDIEKYLREAGYGEAYNYAVL